jgi:excisionase family DNA binding protein
MNLADAIRQAAQRTGTDPFVAAMRPEVSIVDNPAYEASARQEFDTPALSLSHGDDAHDKSHHHANVVRLELLLSPDQLRNLFGAIVSTQHGVMTLREAAAFLRTSTAALEAMAHDNKIPAFLIDGKWRFSRAAIDEWLQLQATAKETEV